MSLPDPFSPEPLAYFLTWTTYGSWLPGDRRGWSDRRGVMRDRLIPLEISAARRLKGPVVKLAPAEQHLVATVIEQHCRYRRWPVLALACRSQHVHAVVTASSHSSAQVTQQLKAWTARALAATEHPRPRVWTRGGSQRRIYGERDLQAVVRYVAECQDGGRG